MAEMTYIWLTVGHVTCGKLGGLSKSTEFSILEVLRFGKKRNQKGCLWFQDDGTFSKDRLDPFGRAVSGTSA